MYEVGSTCELEVLMQGESTCNIISNAENMVIKIPPFSHPDEVDINAKNEFFAGFIHSSPSSGAVDRYVVFKGSVNVSILYYVLRKQKIVYTM